MTLQTRKPTGLPSWPCLLIAGAEKAGKSWACAQASSSEKISRTLWVSIGETDPDQYGAIEGANFEIVEHDGTLKGIRSVLWEIASLPAEEKPVLLVVDSMTRLWEMITDQAQAIANERQSRRGRGGSGEAQITMDLWNKAKAEWGQMISAILSHQGPALLTARLDEVTVMDDAGKPTAQKTDKIRAEKNLPFEVDGVVKMPKRGTTILTGIRSTFLQLDEPTEVSPWSVDGMWNELGLETVAARTYSEPVSPEAQLEREQPREEPTTRRPEQTQPPAEGPVVGAEEGPQAQAQGPTDLPPPPADWELAFQNVKRNPSALSSLRQVALNSGTCPPDTFAKIQQQLAYFERTQK